MDDRFSDPIATFDGSDYAPLDEALGSVPPSADQLAGFVVLLEVGDVRAQTAASWLLQRCLEFGYPLLPSERRRIVAVLADSDRVWEVSLHLCHAVRWLKTPPDVAQAAASALEQLIASPHREVRAATLDALDGLTSRFPKLVDRAEAAIGQAHADPAPSVRAQARLIECRRAAA